MLDPFAQLFQHCWGHARSLRVVYKDLWVVSFPRCTAGPNIVGSCCIRLHTTANMNATTANIVAPTMLGVVASVCTQPNGDEVYNTVNWIQISCRHCRGCSSTSSLTMSWAHFTIDGTVKASGPLNCALQDLFVFNMYSYGCLICSKESFIAIIVFK